MSAAAWAMFFGALAGWNWEVRNWPALTACALGALLSLASFVWWARQ